MNPEQSDSVEISPVDLKAKLERGEDLLILDVRTEQEFAVANLGGHLIPLGQLPGRLEELDSSREIVVHCHHGMRSLQAVHFLIQSGFTKVKNLAGGIDRWSREVDPSVPQY